MLTEKIKMVARKQSIKIEKTKQKLNQIWQMQAKKRQ